MILLFIILLLLSKSSVKSKRNEYTYKINNYKYQLTDVIYSDLDTELGRL